MVIVTIIDNSISHLCFIAAQETEQHTITVVHRISQVGKT